MKYTYNENAFKDNTEEMYYFLGFIFADGCLNKNGSISININKKDIEILEKFKKYLQTDKPIFYLNKTNSIMFTFGNKNILSTLKSFGLTQKKSLTLKFPSNIPNNMINHFIRGYFDGDGCVSILHGKNLNRIRINLVGTYEFLFSIQEFLIRVLKINETKIINMTKGKNTYQFNIKKKEDTLKVRDFFYLNSSIYLIRKKEIFYTNTEIKNNNFKTSSKYKNICYRKRTKSWSAMYYLNGKRIEKSGFNDEETAYYFIKNLGEGIIPSPK